MATVIPQRELRNHNTQIIERVAAGESFTVTRNGVPVADVVPHLGTTKSPRFRAAASASARSRLSAAAGRDWLDDIAALRESVNDIPRDPWEDAARG